MVKESEYMTVKIFQVWRGLKAEVVNDFGLGTLYFGFDVVVNGVAIASYWKPGVGDHMKGKFDLVAGEKAVWSWPPSEIQRHPGLRQSVKPGATIRIQLYNMWPNRAGPQAYLYTVDPKAVSNTITYQSSMPASVPMALGGAAVGGVAGYVAQRKLMPAIIGAALGGGLGYGVGYVVEEN